VLLVCARGGRCRRRTRWLLEPMTVSVIAAVLAMPSSIIGNETAIRFGRHRAMVLFMCIARIIAILIGLTAGAAPLLLLPILFLYSIAIPADSGALTSGMTLSAEPEYRGAAMAMHSTSVSGCRRRVPGPSALLSMPPAAWTLRPAGSARF
jgi:MFS family permease